MTPATDGPVGRRQIVTYNTTGQPRYATQDLSPADFLNPQPGDNFFHGETHDALVAYLVRCFHHLYRYYPFVAVLSNAKIIWDDPALAQPAPDLAVVANLPDPRRFRNTLDVAAEGAAPHTILEVTSPRLAEIDLVDKRDLYARAHVQEYWIIQPTPSTETGPARLIIHAYQLHQGRYQPILPGDDGRFYSAANKVWLVADACGGLSVIEERTGRTIQPPEDDDEPSDAARIEATQRAQSIAAQLKLGR